MPKSISLHQILNDKKAFSVGSKTDFQREIEKLQLKMLRIQLARFEERLRDPYKQWKLSEDDIEARKKWLQYVEAVDEMFQRTNLGTSRWNLIPADHKSFARKETLKIVTSELKLCEAWIEKRATKLGKRSLEVALKQIGKKKKDICR